MSNDTIVTTSKLRFIVDQINQSKNVNKHIPMGTSQHDDHNN